MKKLIIILLNILMVLSVFGCNKQEDITFTSDSELNENELIYNDTTVNLYTSDIDIINSFSINQSEYDSIYKTISNYVNDGQQDRLAGSKANDDLVNYIRKYLKDCGYNTSLQNFAISSYTSDNNTLSYIDSNDNKVIINLYSLSSNYTGNDDKQLVFVNKATLADIKKENIYGKWVLVDYDNNNYDLVYPIYQLKKYGAAGIIILDTNSDTYYYDNNALDIPVFSIKKEDSYNLKQALLVNDNLLDISLEINVEQYEDTSNNVIANLNNSNNKIVISTSIDSYNANNKLINHNLACILLFAKYIKEIDYDFNYDIEFVFFNGNVYGNNYSFMNNYLGSNTYYFDNDNVVFNLNIDGFNTNNIDITNSKVINNFINTYTSVYKENINNYEISNNTYTKIDNSGVIADVNSIASINSSGISMSRLSATNTLRYYLYLIYCFEQYSIYPYNFTDYAQTVKDNLNNADIYSLASIDFYSYQQVVNQFVSQCESIDELINNQSLNSNYINSIIKQLYKEINNDLVYIDYQGNISLDSVIMQRKVYALSDALLAIENDDIDVALADLITVDSNKIDMYFASDCIEKIILEYQNYYNQQDKLSLFISYCDCYDVIWQLLDAKTYNQKDLNSIYNSLNNIVNSQYKLFYDCIELQKDSLISINEIINKALQKSL